MWAQLTCNICTFYSFLLIQKVEQKSLKLTCASAMLAQFSRDALTPIG